MHANAGDTRNPHRKNTFHRKQAKQIPRAKFNNNPPNSIWDSILQTPSRCIRLCTTATPIFCNTIRVYSYLPDYGSDSEKLVHKETRLWMKKILDKSNHLFST